MDRLKAMHQFCTANEIDFKNNPVDVMTERWARNIKDNQELDWQNLLEFSRQDERHTDKTQ